MSKEWGFEYQKGRPDFVNIIYKDKVYGEWNNDANCDYPEDLTIERDLPDLIEIGIKIGRQMEIDSRSEDYNERDLTN